MNMMTMEELFVRAGLNYNEMEKNEFYDVSDKNIKIRSFNHKTKKNEYKRILSLVRKDDSNVYQLVSYTGDIVLKCSGAHRIFDIEQNDYVHVQDVENCVLLNSSGEKVKCFVRKTNEIVPIVDMEVEDNSNYYTNGILSHNTTTGGNSLKYYDSIRIKFSKIGSVEEGTGDNKEKVSIRVKAETTKNKTFPPYKKGEFIISFGKGIDNKATVIEGIIERGIVQKKGAWIAYEGENIAQGITKFKELLEQKPELYEEMKKKLEDKLKGNVVELKEEQIEAETMSDEQIVNEVQEKNEIVESGEI